MTNEEAIKILKGAIKKPNTEDGYMGQALEMAIKALEQQTCEGAVSRQAVKEFVEYIQTIKDKYNDGDLSINYGTICALVIRGWKLVESEDVIKDMPLANPQPKPTVCEDAVSRQAVKDKLLKLCNELEGIFADIRMKEVDDCVCGLCEYDCDHGIDGSAFECPGFETDECFKLADEIRYEWQNTKDLPSVNPQPQVGYWIYISKRRLVDETDEGGIYITDYKCTCSECGGDFGFQKMSDAYCKYCGARMINSQESEG